jgi:hypothetical protein
MKGGSYRNQSGIVSFVVTLIMMLVITLIILGFAQISRRESEQALDRQLSTQAYYAAETGVNDAKKAIIDSVNAGTGIQPKGDCGTTPAYPANPVLDTTSQVEYTCLLIDTSLPELTVDLKASGDSENIPYEPAGGVATNLLINWAPVATPTTAAYTQCDGNIPPLTPGGYFDKAGPGGWDCPYGVLRMDIVKTADALGTPVYDRAVMLANQKTVFFFPTRTGGSTAAYGTLNGRVQSMNCQINTDCNVTVTGLPAGKFALRFNAVYQDGTVIVRAENAGNPVNLNNGQVLVDATGKARDVLRRIQVRLPLGSTSKSPDYPLESGSSVCKRFEVQPPNISNSTGINAQDLNNPMCLGFSSSPPPIACTLDTDIVIAADTTTSMQAELSPGVTRWAKEIQLLKQLVANVQIGPTEPNRGALIGFAGYHTGTNPWTDNRITYYLPLTTSVTALQTGINSLTMKPGTWYQYPLEKAQTAFGEGSFRSEARKVLVFLTDGENNNNENDATVLARATSLKNAGVSLFTIGIGNDSNFQLLQQMATPGKSYSATTAAGFDAAIAAIQAQIAC